MYKIGVKFDDEKPRYDLISSHAMNELAKVLTYGANKYNTRNWELGISWCRVFSACMRHLWAWLQGERYDKESKLPHLAHAFCNIMFLLEYDSQKPEYRKFDDRPKRNINNA